MTSKITSLSSYRAAQEPHWQGECLCVGCGHRFESVGPIGKVDGLECPKCHMQKAACCHPMLREGDHFKCACGSFGFMIDRSSVYCMNCGERHYPESFQ